MLNTLSWAVYARKSSEPEERQAASLDDQQAVVERLAHSINANISYRLEEARSAKVPDNRPVFTELLKLIRSGKVNGILCWHVDRLSRNPVDAGHIQMLLQDGKLQCIKTPERTYLPQDNAVIFAVDASMANQYSRDLSRNVARGLNEKADRGWWPGKAKPGYKNVVVNDVSIIVVDQPRFSMLRSGVDRLVTGTFSIAQVFRYLKESGFTVRGKRGRSKPLTRSTFYRMMSDRFYIGEYFYNSRLTKGLHKPLMTRAEFDLIQRLLGRPTRIRSVKESFAFAGGLMSCGTCGCAITAERKTKVYKTTGRIREYVYYRCTGAKGCPKHTVTEADLSGQFAELFERCSMTKVAVEVVEPVIEQCLVEESSQQQTLVTVQHGGLRDSERKLDALMEMRLSGELTPTEYLAKKKKIASTIVDAESALVTVAERQRRIQGKVSRALGAVIDGDTRFAAASAPEKRGMVSDIADQYFLTLGNLSYRLDPLLELFVTFELPKMTPQQVQSKLAVAACPIRRSIRDVIRNLITEEETRCLKAT